MSNRSIELEDTLKLALEALGKAIRYGSFHGADWAFNEIEEAIHVIKEALSTKCVAQPAVAEPHKRSEASKPLTDEEIAEMWQQYNPLHGIASFARAIEAAHGIKE